MSETTLEHEKLDFKKILPIFVIVLVDLLGLTIILPLLPVYAAAFGADPLNIGVLLAAYPVMQLLGGPLLGGLSDRFGRKPVLIISQFGTLIGFLILAFANTLPLLFRSLDEVDYVRQHMDAGILKDILDQGFVSFGLSEGGFAYLMSNKPLTRTRDLKGQKVWAPEGDRISRAAFESMDISPVPLPLSDVLTGLQTGLIDTVATSYTGAIALQWYTQVKYVTEMPLMYIYGTMIIDRKAFDKLDAADQAVVREVMGGVFRKLNTQSRSSNAQAYQALSKQGIHFVQPSAEERRTWEKATAGAMQQLANEGVFSPDLLQTLRGYLADYRRAHPGQ